MPTNNQEKWEEEFKDKWLAGDFDSLGGYPTQERIKSFLRQEIRQAKIEGMEEVREITSAWDQAGSLDECLGEIDKLISNLKNNDNTTKN